MATSPPPAQTTLLVGGSNGTATLCAILGDRSKPANANHTLRVATRSSKKYLHGGRPRTWRCREKQHLSDLVSADFFPTRITTHVGAPDSVFVYGNDENNNSNDGGEGSDPHADLSPLERAISGASSPDDGGVADVIVLCCPVSAHLSLLRRIARALYSLDARSLLGAPNRPPILIGTLYGAGGFDWMSRIAFFRERPAGFDAWKRPLALFGLKAFPYLCKSLQAGEVSLHGRFPQLQVAVTPSNAYVRGRARVLLDRVLQNPATGKKLEFLGLSGKEDVGGDGTAGEETLALGDDRSGMGYGGVETANSARSAMMIAAQTHKQLKQARDGSPSGPVGSSVAPAVLSAGASGHAKQLSNSIPAPPALDMLLTRSLSDHADPSSALGFLTCTLNSTNQILHPCILVALFSEEGNDDGAITWNPKREGTPLPRFYADGAAKPLAGQLITAIAGAEMYFVIDALERLLSPRGYDPITALHGGEPVGRMIMNALGNSPHRVGERSGLTDVALRNEWRSLFGKGDGGATEEDNGQEDASAGNRAGLIRWEGVLAKCMSFGLSHNSRLNAVLSPCIVDEASKSNEDGTLILRPNARTRFFTDDTQHGLCIYLGLAELLGFDLERDMKQMLHVVRKLQGWMGKEFVLPEGAARGNEKIVGSARNVAETSAPQAFGVRSVRELQQFLRLDVFGEVCGGQAQGRLGGSQLVSRL